jgi:hypothetical protein
MPALVIALSLAAACAQDDRPLATPDEEGCIEAPASWRRTATEADRARLRGWRTAWDDALAQARAIGVGAEIEREGPLLDPDAALPDPAPPVGEYRCRTIKLGSPNGLLPYVAYPAFRCRVSADAIGLRLVKETGSQRPNGRLFVDRGRRMIFLGTMQLSDETRYFRYGIDADRDVAGILERVGEARWRLVIPSPRFESLLDVIELVPAR